MPVRAVAAVNLAAIERNCARLKRELADGARLAAVVKADGYGHGAVPAARAAAGRRRGRGCAWRRRARRRSCAPPGSSSASS